MHGRGTHLAFADAGNTFQLAIIVVFRGWGRRHPIGLMTRAAWPSPRSWHPIMDPIMEKKSKKKKHDDRLIARDSETDLTVSQCWIRGMNAVMVSDIILRDDTASQFAVAQPKQLLLTLQHCRVSRRLQRSGQASPFVARYGVGSGALHRRILRQGRVVGGSRAVVVPRLQHCNRSRAYVIFGGRRSDDERGGRWSGFKYKSCA